MRTIDHILDCLEELGTLPAGRSYDRQDEGFPALQTIDWVGGNINELLWEAATMIRQQGRVIDRLQADLRSKDESFSQERKWFVDQLTAVTNKCNELKHERDSEQCGPPVTEDQVVS